MKNVLAAGAVSLLALSGCAAEGDGVSADDAAEIADAAEITFLTFQSPNLTAEYWETQVAEVQELYPNLKVNIEYTPGLDRQGYAKQLLATGTLPDVIWDVPLQDFVTAGALLPYDQEDLTGIDVPSGTAQFDGKSYSLTVGAQVIPLVYYNKTEFEALDLQVPTTFAELEDVAAAIAASGQTPFLVGGGADTWTSTMLLNGIITTEVIGANADWVEQRKAGDVSFSDANFKGAVEKWMGLFDRGYFNTDALSVDYGQLSAKFANGEGVLYPMGSWAGATKADFEIGVFPLPGATTDTTLGLNYGQALAVSATTKFPKEAQAFAIAMATGQGTNEAQLIFDTLIPVATAFQVPAGLSPLIEATLDAYRSDGAARVDPFGWVQGPRALPTGFSDEFNKGAQQLLSGSITIDQFLAQIDASFDDLNAG
jgi:ABC-type glycerol-3-phosphate transport system substrate-binding protein